METEDAVIEKIKRRRNAGRQKYGTTMERTDLGKLAWMVHFQEELMDAAIYVERLIREETEKSSDPIKVAAKALCEKIRIIHDDPLYQSVWLCALNHGVSYADGPTYENELKQLENLVNEK